VLAILYGVPVRGFAVLWIFLAASLTVRTLRRGTPFALTWWSLTFPVGMFVTRTTQLAAYTALPAFRTAAAVGYVGLLFTGILVAVRTARDSLQGNPFQRQHDADQGTRMNWLDVRAPRSAVGPPALHRDSAEARNNRRAVGVVAHMSRAVRFDHYGDIDVLEVREVGRPVPGAGEVLVEVKAAGINPGEAKIRTGALHEMWPATFPSGQGSDLAGVVAEAGPGVAEFDVGDEVLGFSEKRSSQAEFVAVPATQLTAKPPTLSWDVAGSLFVAGTTAYAAVRSVALAPGDVVAVAGAAGGVGTIAVQLAGRTGATVLGIAGPGNDDWLTDHGVIPVNYGDNLAERLRAASPSGRIDAFLDLFGGGYVEMAVNDLGVAPARVDTIIDFPAVAKLGVQAAGNADAASAAVLAKLADMVAAGELEVPIAGVFSLDDVQSAYRSLEQQHTRGKLVLRP
jgi:NADPH:quinone reductase-like Zn-dependent oxidoreductase